MVSPSKALARCNAEIASLSAAHYHSKATRPLLPVAEVRITVGLSQYRTPAAP